MKTKLIALILLAFVKVCYSQNYPSVSKDALYVVTTEDKEFITDQSGVMVDEKTAAKDAMPIDPYWVKSIDVVKGQTAIDKYGDRGKNGVVVIHLEQEGFDKLSSSDQAKFKKK